MELTSPKPLAYIVALVVAGSLVACSGDKPVELTANSAIDGNKKVQLHPTWEGTPSLLFPGSLARKIMQIF